MTLLVGLPDSCGGWWTKQEFSPASIIIIIIITMALQAHITWGMNSRPIRGRGSEV
jgi:hypothetical protein